MSVRHEIERLRQRHEAGDSSAAIELDELLAPRLRHIVERALRVPSARPGLGRRISQLAVRHDPNDCTGSTRQVRICRELGLALLAKRRLRDDGLAVRDTLRSGSELVPTQTVRD